MQTVWSTFKCPATKQMRCPVNDYALIGQVSGQLDRVIEGRVIG